mgnify:CR=1 FL=1
MITAQEAFAMGLVNRIVPQAQLVALALLDAQILTRHLGRLFETEQAEHGGCDVLQAAIPA